MSPRPPDFDRMFRNGARYRWSGQDDSVQHLQEVGLLDLATGHLVACDPFWETSILRLVTPFSVVVEPGRYSVTLAISQWDQPAGSEPVKPLRLVGAAKVSIRDEPAVTWEPARRHSDPDEGGRIIGFSVDSGIGCFLDAAAVEPLVRMSGPGGLLERDTKDIAEAAGVTITDSETALNIVAFKCGMGDGMYPTWIGRTTAGEVACFIANLSLLHHSLGPVETNPRASD